MPSLANNANLYYTLPNLSIHADLCFSDSSKPAGNPKGNTKGGPVITSKYVEHKPVIMVMVNSSALSVYNH